MRCSTLGSRVALACARGLGSTDPAALAWAIGSSHRKAFPLPRSVDQFAMDWIDKFGRQPAATPAETALARARLTGEAQAYYSNYLSGYSGQAQPTGQAQYALDARRCLCG